ncbi:hypothetical protein M2103_002021 [Ereboglobus sp. PH5-5]|uniref:hypothetical protein n=1 Tax=Ereboglobus sp. PH5-5 TaxID=2940529 RepID=UPI002406D684|nr:hypothetical protein [Ereboglobus sp. PH5-5]MDF9833788.1 hypothetical protein [Ereboglobus sp. PH5-5]
MENAAYIIVFAMVVSLVLIQINRTEASPIIALVNRWLRWGIFSTGGAYVLKGLLMLDHPYWMLVVMFALIWFLGETLYNWMAIKAYSYSELPLFPNYEPNESGEEWPTQKRFLKMREDIRANGFVHLCSMRARVMDSVHVRISVYQDASTATRLQITFLPQTKTNGMATIIGLSTLTADGCRYVTDNTFMPYAGFYPENWFVERRPWIRSLTSLLKRHKNRLEKNNETPVPHTSDPLEETNAHQRMIERLNVEMGFLTTPLHREEQGRITNAGRYRTWKELWTLNYLGKSMRYS